MAGGLLEDEEGQSDTRPGQFWCLFVPQGFKPRISLEKQGEGPEKEAQKDIFIDPNEVLRDVLESDETPNDVDEKKVLTHLETPAIHVKCEPENESDASFESSKRTNRTEESRNSKTDMFKCTPCQYETRIFHALGNHLNTVHQICKASEYFRCEKCKQKTQTWISMKNHLNTHAKKIVTYNCSFDLEKKRRSCRTRTKTKKERSPSPIEEVDIPFSPFSNDSEEIVQLKEIVEPADNENIKDEAFTCALCPFETSEESGYKSHIKSHEVTFLKCELCSFEAKNQEEQDQHILKHHMSFDDQEKLRCSFCRFETRKKLVLRKHMLSEHQIATKMVDKVKTEKKSSLLRLRRSKRDKNQQELFYCDKCDYKSKFKCSLKTHMLRHRNPEEISKEFMCEICSSCFRTKATLEKHLLRHKSIEEVEHFQCIECNYKTKFKFNLNKHMMIHMDPSEIKMFQCDICGFQCKRKYNFKNHQLTHKSEEEVPVYRCALCAYKTKCKDYLAAHLKKGKHLGIRSREKGRTPQCKTCGYETKDYANLYRHTLIHKNIDEMDENKIFRCDQCDYKTLFKIRLQTHSKIHKRMDEVQTFDCPHCDYKAKMKGNLKAHIDKVHKHPSERKTFQCHICPLQLKSSSNLKMHLLTHKSSYEIEMIKCQICSYETKFKSYMRMHLKKKHNILAPSTKRRGISYTNQNIGDPSPLHPPGNDYYRKSVYFCKSASREDEKTGRKSSKKELFTCTPCSYESEELPDLKCHIKLIHHINEASECFRCKKCHQETQEWKAMKTHLLTHAKKDLIVFNCSFETKKKECKPRSKHKREPKQRRCKIKEFYFDDDLSNDERQETKLRGPKAKVKLLESDEDDVALENDDIEPSNKIETLTCNICPFEAVEEEAFKNHLKSHHDLKLLKCDFCSFETDDDPTLKTHVDITHTSPKDSSTLKCSFCKFETRKKFVLRKHMYNAHQIATKMVDKENQKDLDFSSPRSPLSKLRRKRAAKQEKTDWYYCDKCEFKTRFRCSLKTHGLKHKSPHEIEKKFMCETCSACFRTRAYLASHMLKHKSLDECQTYQCGDCDYRTKFKYNLTKHILKHKDPSECPMFQCEICGFKCKRKYNFKNHQLTHKSEDEVPVYKCAICAYQTKCKDYLAAHLKKGTHLGQRKRGKVRKFTDTKCNVCGIQMKDPGNLYRHTLTHKNIEEVDENMIFRCDQCDYKTLFKGRLVMHEKIHKRMEEVETFSCPHCDYKSKMKGNLKQHINKVHVHPSERKTFQCHVCSIQLKSSSNLKTHLMTHKSSFEAEMIKCQICSYETKFKSYMRMHLKKKHNILAPSAKRRGISYTNQNTDERGAPPQYF